MVSILSHHNLFNKHISILFWNLFNSILHILAYVPKVCHTPQEVFFFFSPLVEVACYNWCTIKMMSVVKVNVAWITICWGGQFWKMLCMSLAFLNWKLDFKAKANRPRLSIRKLLRFIFQRGKMGFYKKKKGQRIILSSDLTLLLCKCPIKCQSMSRGSYKHKHKQNHK